MAAITTPAPGAWSTALLRTPMLPRYDSGDHIHPGDAGYRAMAEAVPLALSGCDASSAH